MGEYKEMMLDYLNTKTKWHNIKYEDLETNILRIIFVLYKNIDRYKATIKHLEQENKQLEEKLNKKEDRKQLEEISEILNDITDNYEDIKNLIDKINEY